VAEWEEIKKWLPVIVLLGLGYLIYKKITAPPPEAPAVEFVKLEWVSSSPVEFAPESTQTARVTLRNPTAYKWTYDVYVMVGYKRGAGRITIEAGREETVPISIVMPLREGKYDVILLVFVDTEEILRRVVDTVDIVVPPKPAVEFVRIEWLSPEVFAPYSRQTALLTVKNTSAKEWTYAFHLEVLAPVVAMGLSDEVTFKPGEQKPVRIEVTMPLDEGTFDVKVGAVAKVDGWERVSEMIIDRVQIARSSFEFVIR